MEFRHEPVTSDWLVPVGRPPERPPAGLFAVRPGARSQAEEVRVGDDVHNAKISSPDGNGFD
jgi:hypothetical protein